jgi:hypothetical protein
MPRLALHVGLPKSGTTYLQGRLVKNAASLAAHQVLVPLGEPAEGRGSLPFRAALDLTGKRLGRPDAYAAGYWGRLVEQATGYDGDVVISHEAFVRCSAEQAARAVRELGRHHEVHVLVTAQDPARSLASSWLEGLRHGTTHDLADHVRRAREDALPVLRALDLPRVLSLWSGAVPADRVHAITVPWGDRSALWPRFCVAADIPPAAAPLEPGRANRSFGVPEAQLMLALNRLLGAEASRSGRLHKPLSRIVSRRLERLSSAPVSLDREATEWASVRARSWASWLTASDVDVIGAVDELLPQPFDPGTWTDPSLPHPDVAASAAHALLAVLERAPEVARLSRPDPR